MTLSLFAQTSLTQGDIALLGYNARNGDFAFLFTKEIVSGTAITFTNKGWKDTGGWRVKSNGDPLTGDANLIWTADKTYAIGDVIVINGTDSFNGDGTTGTGVITGDALTFQIAGDYIYCYQGAEPTTNSDVSRFVTMLGMNGNLTSGGAGGTSRSNGDLPSSLTIGSDCLIIVPEKDNAVYQGMLENGTSTDLKTNIFDKSKWASRNGTNAIPTPYSLKLYENSGDIGVSGILTVADEKLTTTIYPTIVDAYIKIETSVDLLAITLFDLTGAVVKTSKESLIHVSSLPSGVYFISVETKLGITTKKIIKR